MFDTISNSYEIIKILKKKGSVFCKLPNANNEWGLFSEPEKILTTTSKENTLKILQEVDNAKKTKRFVCGFLSYEAGIVFDKNHNIVEDEIFPYIWFAIFKKPPLKVKNITHIDFATSANFIHKIKKNNYIKTVEGIKKKIFEGDIYQANYTFRTISKKLRNPEKIFLKMFDAHSVPYSAYVNTGDFQVISMSPELFIQKNGQNIISSPMKGTIAKHFLHSKDNVSKLKNDTKNRAENLMIVDMVRNDLGRICKKGSIKVSSLFDVKTFSTVHQMISDVEGVLKANISLNDILSATYPPASITGTPKIKAMEIIANNEKTARKIYTGSIGCIDTNGDFCFNVAIRTLLNSAEHAELGIGGAIIADSAPESEWEEALAKSNFFAYSLSNFQILETLLWEKEKGFYMLEEHITRMRTSQKYFNRNINENKIKESLNKLTINLDNTSANFAKTRLLLSSSGDIQAEYTVLEYPNWVKPYLKIDISKQHTDSHNIFLYHKTTNRDLYNNEFKNAIQNGFDDILFLNQKDEITECAISNIFIKKNNKWFTPAISSGLLPGIWRSLMIKKLQASEKILFLKDLHNADKIIIGNSVRGTGMAIIK